ncbi:hypothetical protein [Nitrospirillum amazonense]|uniref:hypothetical protein n=1 Tax=Nitrospirillum amazonense TaxID=28077 RepID=UPI002412DB16|nr:hypothetical protein [Nitrospirillum amazonense]MDG3444643.1 hypothetical protein [Nitrospirillum amazonense]
MQMHNYDVDAIGVAKRPPFFDKMVSEAQSWTGTTAPAASIMTLLSAGFAPIMRRDTLMPLSHKARSYLTSLVAKIHTDNWRSGHATLRVRNAELALHWQCTERQVRAVLQDLENAGLLIRRYDHLNRRQWMSGIDLAPLGMMLNDLAEANAAAKERFRGDYQSLRHDRDETDVLYEKKTSGDPEEFCPHKYNVQAYPAAKQQPVQPQAGCVIDPPPPPTGAQDETILHGIIAHCPQLPAMAGNSSPSPAPTDFVRAAQTILHRDHSDLRPSAWEAAVKRHGAIPCIAAVAVAAAKPADRSGSAIGNRTAYLAKMLASQQLRQTVMSQLRGLKREKRPVNAYSNS